MQMLIGLPLTLITASGLLALVALAVRAPRRRLAELPIAALPVVGLASIAVYAWRYPSADGDTVKALFLLPAAPAFAAAFGFAVDVARPHLPLVRSSRSRRPAGGCARRVCRVRGGRVTRPSGNGAT